MDLCHILKFIDFSIPPTKINELDFTKVHLPIFQPPQKSMNRILPKTPFSKILPKIKSPNSGISAPSKKFNLQNFNKINPWILLKIYFYFTFKKYITSQKIIQIEYLSLGQNLLKKSGHIYTQDFVLLIHL